MKSRAPSSPSSSAEGKEWTPPPDPLRPAPGVAERGRGATFNPGNRFRREGREAYDDGWPRTEPAEDGVDADAPPPRLKTTVTIQRARTIVTRNDSPDIPFTQSINPYQGCEHEIRTSNR